MTLTTRSRRPSGPGTSACACRPASSASTSTPTRAATTPQDLLDRLGALPQTWISAQRPGRWSRASGSSGPAGADLGPRLPASRSSSGATATPSSGRRSIPRAGTTTGATRPSVDDRRQRAPGRGPARAALAVDHRAVSSGGQKSVHTQPGRRPGPGGRVRRAHTGGRGPGVARRVIMRVLLPSWHPRRAIPATTPCSTDLTWAMEFVSGPTCSPRRWRSGGWARCGSRRWPPTWVGLCSSRARVGPPSSRPCWRHAVGKANAKTEDELFDHPLPRLPGCLIGVRPVC